MERSQRLKPGLSLQRMFVPRLSFVVVFLSILISTACGGGGSKSVSGSAPAAPTNLTATAVSTSQINLSWTASPGATSYNVVSSTANSGPTIVTGVTTTSYSNTGLTASTAYHYEVQAVNSYGTSGGSNRASATTLGPPALVQINASDPEGTPPPAGVNSVQATYVNEQNAGDMNIVAIGMNDALNTITSVTDSSGNTYNLAVGQNQYGGSQAIYYASNIKAAAAGANTVTVTFGNALDFPDLRILEYANVNTLDQTASAIGTGASLSSGSVTTTVASELLFGTDLESNSTLGVGSGFTQEMSTSDGDIVEDEVVSATGSYVATATGVNATDQWIMQLATFYQSVGAAPTSLTATPASSSQINLSWTAASGATSYNVLGSTTSGGPYTTVAAGVNTTSYSNMGLSGATTYYYVVRAVNSGGTSSSNSNQALAVTQGTPAAPTWLIATAASSSQINLTWTAPTGATSYNVLSSTTSGGPYTQIASGVTTTSYSNTGLTPATTYYYVVQSVNSGSSSGNSNQASATTQGGPAVPVGLAATAVSSSQINLIWMPSSGATSYNVLRSTTSGGPYSTIATGVTTASYADTGLAVSTTYFYVVQAVNSTATSGYSHEASATTTVNMQAVFYASPTGSGTCLSSDSPCSLAGAQAQVQAVNSNMTGNIIVYLQGGTYDLSSSPLALTNADSGTNGYNVIYQAVPGATVIFDGGYSVPASAWSLHDSSLNIWQANVGTMEFRQIYVNGTRAVRARSPNQTDPVTMEPYYTALNNTSPFQVQSSQVYNWPNMNQVGAPEFVYQAYWLQKRARIASYTTSGSTATLNFMSSDTWMESYTSYADQPTTYFYLENAYELLDAPGEWFLDLTVNPHVLYYIPLSGQSMSNATVTVPVAQSVVTITGSSASSPVQNIQLLGITLQDTNWTLPDNCGYFDWQAGEQGLCSDTSGNISTQETPGAVYITNGQNITLQNNTFQHTGANGLLIQGSNNVQVLNNTFTDLSSGGVFIDGYDIGLTDTNDRVSNNLVDSFGQHYADAVGIFTEEGVSNTYIQYNEVRYGRYTGIDPGMWDGNPGMDGMTNIYVQYNKVHHVMELQDDGAGIYTDGDTPNMYIQNNYIYSLTPSEEAAGSPVVGIYLDQQSNEKTVQNNVLDNTHKGFSVCLNSSSAANTFTNNYYNELMGCIDSNQTVTNDVYVTGEDWPPAAQAIISGAGIQ